MNLVSEVQLLLYSSLSPSCQLMHVFQTPLLSSLSISVCRTAVSKYGLWDQVRIDHGREFYLVLYIQEQLRRLYGARDVLPYAHKLWQ